MGIGASKPRALPRLVLALLEVVDQRLSFLHDVGVDRVVGRVDSLLRWRGDLGEGIHPGQAGVNKLKLRMAWRLKQDFAGPGGGARQLLWSTSRRQVLWLAFDVPRRPLAWSLYLVWPQWIGRESARPLAREGWVIGVPLEMLVDASEHRPATAMRVWCIVLQRLPVMLKQR